MTSSTRLFRVNPSMDPALRAWGRGALLAAALASTLTLQGCEVLALGAVAGGSAVVAVDRRTTGIQLEDKTIEIKVGQRAKELVGDKGNVNATAYNRAVLLTGEVPTEADRAALERAAGQVENVKGAAGVSGVKKVVRVFEMISAEEVLRLRSKATGTR